MCASRTHSKADVCSPGPAEEEDDVWGAALGALWQHEQACRLRTPSYPS